MQNCALGLTVRQLGELLGGKFTGLQANHVRGIVSFGAGNMLLGPSMGGQTRMEWIERVYGMVAKLLGLLLWPHAVGKLQKTDLQLR